MRIVWQLLKKPRFSFLRLLPLLLLPLFCVSVWLHYCHLIADCEQDYRQDSDYSRWDSSNLLNPAEAREEYLVWSSKCHMLSMKPYDPSIVKLVKREKLEECSSEAKLLTSIERETNGTINLMVNRDAAAAKSYGNKLSCCWAAVSSVGPCQRLKDKVALNGRNVRVVLVSCRDGEAGKVLYKNTHSVIEPDRSHMQLQRRRPALSVLMLGLDSVSRLNFYRTMPQTRAYLEEGGWVELRAYNKMADNTFPNLMAILTGANATLSGSGKCPTIIWRDFREAGYVTAYAEDSADISTFNNDKAGFTEPPTDYYFRPYVLASEKLLRPRRRLGSPTYCTGPELSVDRIFDCARDFAKSFLGTPYFGLFWTNSISHESLNGPSMYDARLLDKLRRMEMEGVMNDSMIVMLSDHGMRYGDIRESFVGWYEERLPFAWVWLPPSFRQLHPEAEAALLINRDRLSSPYDLHETLRDVLMRSAGRAPPPSTGCPGCSSLFRPLAQERGCREAGIDPHWCTCSGFRPYDEADPIVARGAMKFVEYVNNLTSQYRTNLGLRLCSELALKRVVRVKRLIDYDEDPAAAAAGKVVKLFYLLELTPGGGKFETTIAYTAPDTFAILEEQVSRINLYGHDAICLDKGHKKYCQCRLNVAHFILKWF